MTQDQFLSLIRSVLQIGGTVAVTAGVGTASTWTEIAGGVVAIAGLIWGQYHHATTVAVPNNSEAAAVHAQEIAK
jgi:hypothetical protein